MVSCATFWAELIYLLFYDNPLPGDDEGGKNKRRRYFGFLLLLALAAIAIGIGSFGLKGGVIDAVIHLLTFPYQVLDAAMRMPN